MTTTLQKSVDTTTTHFHKYSQLLLIASLARQIKDATLFEKARMASCETLTGKEIVEIAACAC